MPHSLTCEDWFQNEIRFDFIPHRLRYFQKVIRSRHQEPSCQSNGLYCGTTHSKLGRPQCRTYVLWNDMWKFPIKELSHVVSEHKIAVMRWLQVFLSETYKRLISEENFVTLHSDNELYTPHCTKSSEPCAKGELSPHCGHLQTSFPHPLYKICTTRPSQTQATQLGFWYVSSETHMNKASSTKTTSLYIHPTLH